MPRHPSQYEEAIANLGVLNGEIKGTIADDINPIIDHCFVKIIFRREVENKGLGDRQRKSDKEIKEKSNIEVRVHKPDTKSGKVKPAIFGLFDQAKAAARRGLPK